MKTLRIMLLVCFLSVPAFAGIIDAPPCQENCPPPCTGNCLMAEPEPTLQEQLILDSITEFLSILL